MKSTALLFCLPLLCTAAQTEFKFDFGSGEAEPGYTKVTPASKYSAEAGFGFEPGATLTAVDRGGSNKLRGDFVTSEKPFYFSVAVPEGNYRVTVYLGDREGESDTTVKAELRRLMLEKVQTDRGNIAVRSFVVNVRTAKISTGGEVKLKDREKTSEAWAWDEKLTLEFNNTQAKVCGIDIVRAVEVPTIYLAGDSTVTDQPREPHNSWGQMLTRYFGDRIAIANHSESGESLSSFIGERRLAKVMSIIKPGDFLMIQMGHNDEKQKGEGIGAFTTYKASLKKFVADARQKGAKPILVTPMHRRTFGADGKITNSHGDYPEAVRQVAAEEKVPLIDLTAMSKVLYEAMGAEESVKAFAPGDGTHHSSWGSYELARCVVEAIRKGNFDLKDYLTGDAGIFDPAKPDPLGKFAVPASPGATTVKPYGT